MNALKYNIYEKLYIQLFCFKKMIMPQFLNPIVVSLVSNTRLIISYSPT